MTRFKILLLLTVLQIESSYGFGWKDCRVLLGRMLGSGRTSTPVTDYHQQESQTIHLNQLAFQMIQAKDHGRLKTILDKRASLTKPLLDGMYRTGHDLVKEAIRAEDEVALKMILDAGGRLPRFNPTGRTQKTLDGTTNNKLKELVKEQTAKEEEQRRQFRIEQAKNILESTGKNSFDLNRNAQEMIRYGEHELLRKLIEKGARLDEYNGWEEESTDLCRAAVSAEDPIALQIVIDAGGKIGKNPSVHAEIEASGNAELRRVAESQIAKEQAEDMVLANEKRQEYRREARKAVAGENTPYDLNELAHHMIVLGENQLLAKLLEKGALTDKIYDYDNCMGYCGFTLVKSAIRSDNDAALATLFQSGAEIPRLNPTGRTQKALDSTTNEKIKSLVKIQIGKQSDLEAQRQAETLRTARKEVDQLRQRQTP
jgi:hypothetical protein